MPVNQQRGDDGSEDVADFLERIRGLGDRSKTADEERSRQIEEEILQGRKEREARRAERARSISPTKDSPSSTPTRQAAGISNPRSPTISNPTFRATPSRTMADIEPRKSVDLPASPKPAPKTLSLNLDLEPSRPSPPPTSTLSRQGTLSWQQRPSSRGSRPTSLLSLDKPSLSPRVTPAPEPEAKELSRADVAKSLESKDPSWFRQTADRGIGSAAYRKSQESENASSTRSTVQLPRMDERINGHVDGMANIVVPKERTPTQVKEFKNSQTMPLPVSARSPLPLFSTQTFEPLQNNITERPLSPLRDSTMSSAQRDISPERPVSPTKGLGGFVQSAMLRRSDSLNKHKRAGSQLTALGRSDSVTSNQENGLIETPKRTSGLDSSTSPDGTIRQTDTERPLSPTKTIESRRWSPTKQSWLEGAITKTDSPNSRPQSIQSPPVWLSELQKGKESNGTEPAKTPTHKPVTVGGFLRSSHDLSKPMSSPVPMSSKNNDSTSRDTTIVASPSPTTNDAQGLGIRTLGVETTRSTGIVVSSKSTDSESKVVNDVKESNSKQDTTTIESPPITSPKPAALKTNASASDNVKAASKPWERKAVAIEPKTKPEPPGKVDFRAGLRSVNRATDKSKNENLEFKNVFGKLKKTETKNFVAPDELKDNILRGKTGLNVTSGPRAFEKKDEFKDSILKKKQEMKVSVPIKVKSPEPEIQAIVPEAITRQQRLTQKTSVDPNTDQPKPVLETKPVLAQTMSATESAINAVSKPVTGPKPENKSSLEKPAIVEDINIIAGKPLVVKQKSMQVEPNPIPLEKKTSAPAQLQNTGVSNIANRFNPTLAGILARGPPTGISNLASSPPIASPTNIQKESRQENSAASSVHLTHATKDRAKGPKRRAPGNLKADASAAEPELQSSNPTTLRGLSNQSSSSTMKHDLDIATPATFTKSSSGEADFPVPVEDLEPSHQPRAVKVASNAIRGNTLSEPSSKPTNPEPAKPKPIFTKATETKAEKSKLYPQEATISKFPDLTPKSPKSPPPTGSKAKAISKLLANGAAGGLQVPTPGGTFTDFFDNVWLPKINTDIDTQALLTNNRSEEKIRTTRKDIWEINGDGKRLSLTQQDYILFEDKMFLCRHHFQANNRQTTEVYLWHGVQVPPTAVDDAQIFCRSEARDAGCKLTIITQGKESSNFLGALGGILITRRTASVTYMLCGRRHLDQIVFDEVDFSVESLCSGFAFIIATTGGDLYLWKGKGAHADEIGCARLIGMDLGLTGEIEEVEEGSESFGLLSALGVKKLSLESGHWLQKGTSYTARLFIINAESRSRSNSALANFASNVWRRRPSASSVVDSGTVKEISPYNQADITEDGIFVLDAFFQIFVIVGSQTRNKFDTFTMALNFAQEYGILSVSVQDRPFIPQGYVVFLGATGDIPTGIKTAFRKWDDRLQKQKDSWRSATVTMPLIEALRGLEGLEGS